MADLGLERSDRRRTTHEYVRDVLRQAILRRELPWGTRLIQSEIASQLGVSTTPVREALRDLAAEGLVTMDAHRGGVVKRLTFEEIREIHELVRLLDPEAMRLAAQPPGPEDLDAARELAAVMESENHDIGLWVDRNRRFHHALDPTTSPRLVGILRGLRDASAPYTALSLTAEAERDAAAHAAHIDAANRDHRALLNALECGDADAAAGIARRHLDLTVRVFEVSRGLYF